MPDVKKGSILANENEKGGYESDGTEDGDMLRGPSGANVDSKKRKRKKKQRSGDVANDVHTGKVERSSQVERAKKKTREQQEKESGSKKKKQRSGDVANDVHTGKNESYSQVERAKKKTRVQEKESDSSSEDTEGYGFGKIPLEMYYYCGCGHINEFDKFEKRNEDMHQKAIIEDVTEVMESKDSSDEAYDHDEDSSGHSDHDEYKPLVSKAIIEDNADELISALDPKTVSELGYGNHKALLFSCSLGKLNCVKAARRVDLFAPDKYGYTPLHMACSNNSEGNMEVVEYLINLMDKQKDVENPLEAVTNHGLTPLHYAALGGSCDIIALLLNHGADPRKKDASNQVPFPYAIPSSRAYEMLKYAARTGRLGRSTLSRKKGTCNKKEP